MTNTTYKIKAPSGGVLFISSEDARKGWTDPGGRLSRVSDLTLIKGMGIDALIRRASWGETPWTLGDRTIWRRERTHPTPLQSFTFTTVEPVGVSAPSKIGLTRLEVLDLIHTLKQARGLADPETALQITPHQLQIRLGNIQSWIQAVYRALERELDGQPSKKATEDGWGHTTEDASVDELIREWEATEKGTDQHERLFQQIMKAVEPVIPGARIASMVRTLSREVAEVNRGLEALRRRVDSTEDFILNNVIVKPSQPAPPSGIVFTPCPPQAFDQQADVALLDSASAPDGPVDSVRFEESCPEPDIPLRDEPGEQARGEEEFQ